MADPHSDKASDESPSTDTPDFNSLRNDWLADLLDRHRERLVEYWAASAKQQASPHYANIPASDLRKQFLVTIDAMIQAFRTGNVEVARQRAFFQIRERYDQGFDLPEILYVIQGLERSVEQIIQEADLSLKHGLHYMRSTFNLYQQISMVVAEVYQQAQLGQEARNKAGYRLSTALGHTLNLESILEIAVKEIADAVQAHSVAIILNDSPAVTASFAMSPQTLDVCQEVCGTMCPDGTLLTSEGMICIASISDVMQSSLSADKIETLVNSGCRALCCMPLVSAGNTLGGIIICHANPQELSDRDKVFYVSLANHVAVAVQNSKLYSKASKDQRNLRLLLQIGSMFVSTLDMQTLLKEIPRLSIDALNADSSQILLPDESTSRLEMTSYAVKDPAVNTWNKELIVVLQKLYGAKKTIQQNRLAGKVFRTGQAVLIPNYREYEEVMPELVPLVGSLIVVPLKVKSRIIGVFAIATRMPYQLTEDELDLASGIAAEAAIAIENARLFEEWKGKRQISVLLEAGKAFTSSLDIDEVLSQTSRIATNAVGADISSVYLLDEEGNRLHFTAFYAKPGRPTDISQKIREITEPAGLETDDGGPWLALKENRPLAIDDYSQFPDRRWLMAELVGSAMLIPMKTRGRKLGVLAIGSEHKGAFTGDDLALAIGLADTAAIAMENAMLYGREKNIAETLQRSFLPESLPTIRGFEISVRYRAALMEAEVGGDFYDAFPVDANSSSLLIADVSGKGLSAAVYTAMGKYMIRAFAAEDPSPSSVLTRLNNAFNKYVSSSLFITTLYGIVDSQQNTIRYASAGHNPPLLFKKDLGFITSLDITGCAIGIVPGAQYSDRTVKMETGDTLLLYTDGATDVRRDGQLLGVEGLEDMLHSNLDKSVEDLLDSIMGGINHYCSGHFSDDIVLIALRRLS